MSATCPNYAFGHRSLMWWGTLGFVAIEGTVFALALVELFLPATQASQWPPGVAPPDLLWGTLNTVILLASLLSEPVRQDAPPRTRTRRGVGLWLVVCLAFGVAFMVVRVLEFTALNVRWDTNAYGSIVWMLLGLHTTHLADRRRRHRGADRADVHCGRSTGKRFVDVSENAFYWYFVVLSWVPIYAVIYLAPRL